MSRKKCPHCEIPVTPTAANVCPFCSRDLSDTSEIDAATLAEMARQSVAARKTAADKAGVSPREERRRMGRKIGFALGMVVGYFVWQMKVRGPGGFILAVFIAIIVEEIFTAIYCALGKPIPQRRTDAEIAAVLADAKSTSAGLPCQHCDYAGPMIARSRHNTLRIAFLIPTVFMVLVMILGLATWPTSKPTHYDRTRRIMTRQPIHEFLVPQFACGMAFFLPFVWFSRRIIVCPKCTATRKAGKRSEQA